MLNYCFSKKLEMVHKNELSQLSVIDPEDGESRTPENPDPTLPGKRPKAPARSDYVTRDEPQAF